MSLSILIAGLTHSVTPLGVAGPWILVSAILVAAGEHRRLSVSWPRVSRVAWVLSVAIVLRLLAQVWFFAPYLGDTLNYYLPKTGEWVTAGGFGRELGIHPHVTLPAGFELIETWWVVFLHHDVLIEMAGVEFLVIAFVATYRLARQLGLAGQGAYFAAGLCVLTPGLHFAATSCLNDLPAAALVVTTAALIVARSPVWEMVVVAGFGIGIKPTYAYAMPGLALLWWLCRRDPAPEAPKSMKRIPAAQFDRTTAWLKAPLRPSRSGSVL